MPSQRLIRCVRLANLAQSRLGHSIEQYAREFGVSKRTIYRDLRLLEEAEIVVRYDPGQGCQVMDPHHSLLPPRLTADELISVLLAAKTSLLSTSPLRNLINQGSAKLLARAPENIREEVNNLVRSCAVAVSCTLWPEGEQQSRLAEILAAIRQKRRIRITYRSTDEAGQSIQTSVAPYRVLISPTSSFLLGRSSLHRCICRFQLQRICATELTQDTFDLPQKFRRHIPVAQWSRECRRDSGVPNNSIVYPATLAR